VDTLTADRSITCILSYHVKPITSNLAL